ncbi:hypothetical protein ACFFWD_25345, partial [Bradyrhizobium erythrophlei]|uniref:hypothetical protein n=1 Tax=Bradyrhizobium erythrophlei TaxID=1437360 RepID=UPI0035EF12C3
AARRVGGVNHQMVRRLPQLAAHCVISLLSSNRVALGAKRILTPMTVRQHDDRSDLQALR